MQHKRELNNKRSSINRNPQRTTEKISFDKEIVKIKEGSSSNITNKKDNLSTAEEKYIELSGGNIRLEKFEDNEINDRKN